MVHTSNGLIEGSLGHLASLVGRVEDLVIEDGEVERETEADGVGGGKIGGSDFGGGLVGFEGLVCGLLALVGRGELGEVAVVVTLPVGSISSSATCVHISLSAGCRRTSCGRRPSTRRSGRRG